MFVLAFLLFTRVLPTSRSRWMAFLLALFGSGLGWVALFFSVTSSDLTIPESIPFLAAYTNAHFPLAAACILWVVLCVLREPRTSLTLAGAGIGASLLAAVLPFSVIGLGIVLVVWMIWEAWWRWRESAETSLKRELVDKARPILAFFVGVAPWGIYDVWVQSHHPVLRIWAQQNITPSPPPLRFLLGYGLVLAGALVGAVVAKPHREASGRLLLVWVLVTGLMLYVPFPLQRRLSLGMFFPLAGLAAMGVDKVFESSRRVNFAFILLLLLSIPSNLVVIGVGLLSVRDMQPLMVLSPQELSAYHWMEKNLSMKDLVLASPETGNRLPAFASVRVFSGHPFETPNSVQQDRLVGELYRGGESVEQVLDRLRSLEVDAVVYGPREESLGPAPWLDRLDPVFQAGDVRIYEVPGGP